VARAIARPRGAQPEGRQREREIGAEEGSDLEPASCDLLLEELENWAEILKDNHEVTHMLAAFGDVAAGETDGSASYTSADEVPSVDWEPSP